MEITEPPETTTLPEVEEETEVLPPDGVCSLDQTNLGVLREVGIMIFVLLQEGNCARTFLSFCAFLPSVLVLLLVPATGEDVSEKYWLILTQHGRHRDQ